MNENKPNLVDELHTKCLYFAYQIRGIKKQVTELEKLKAEIRGKENINYLWEVLIALMNAKNNLESACTYLRLVIPLRIDEEDKNVQS